MSRLITAVDAVEGENIKKCGILAEGTFSYLKRVALETAEISSKDHSDVINDEIYQACKDTIVLLESAVKILCFLEREAQGKIYSDDIEVIEHEMILLKQK